MKKAQLAAALITTDRTVHEAHRRLELGLKRLSGSKSSTIWRQLLRSCLLRS